MLPELFTLNEVTGTPAIESGIFKVESDLQRSSRSLLVTFGRIIRAIASILPDLRGICVRC